MKRTHLLPPTPPPIHSQTCCASFPLFFFSMCMIVFEQTFSSPVFHLSDYRYAIVGNKSILVPRLDGFEVGNLFNIVLPRHKHQRHLICPSVTRAFLRVWLPRTETWGGLPSAPNNRQTMSITCAFCAKPCPVRRSPSLFSSHEIVYRISHRTPPIPPTGSGLEVANRALSLFFPFTRNHRRYRCLAKISSQVIRISFQEYVVFGNDEAVIVFKFGPAISQCLPALVVSCAHGVPSHSLVVHFSGSSL